MNGSISNSQQGISNRQVNGNGRIINGSVLDAATWAAIPDGSVHCCVTSPPYWGLRDYGGWKMCVLVGSLADFAMPRKHPERWLVRMKVRAASRGGIESPNGKAWIGALGLEDTPQRFIAHMVEVFRHVRRVLRDDGTIWLNMGDAHNSGTAADRKPSSRDGYGKHGYWTNENINKRCYAPNLKPKDVCGIPWMLAFALRDDGWYLRQDIIWAKPNPMPESCRDRCTKAHEYIFLLTKKPRYFYDAEAVKEPTNGNAHARGDGVNPKASDTGVGWSYSGSDPSGRTKPRHKQNESFSGSVNQLVARRNKRSVWTVVTQSYPEAHFATFPEALITPCILAGTSARGCCPECGAPWVRVVETERKPTRNVGLPKYDKTHIANRDPARHCTEYRSTGWDPGCECGGDGTVPCTVFDPFIGSGTTAAVATKLGRDYLGIDLNAEYIAMAIDRIGAAEAPTTYVRQTTPDDSPLFAEGGL